MDKKATTKPNRVKPTQGEPSGKQSPQAATPDSFPKPRQRGRPDIIAVSTKGAANSRQKWLELLESSKHSQRSREPLAETPQSAPRKPLGRATATSGKDGDNSTPLSPHKDRRSAGQAVSPTTPIPRAPHGGVQGTSKRPGYGSGRITAVPTSVGAQSPQLFVPEKTRPLSPELSESPPKIRVLVASTTGTPKAQPYGGFSGVPMYIGAPGVIVVTPRVSPTRAGTPLTSRDALPDRGRQKTSAESSPSIDDTGVEESALIIKRRLPTLLQAWALCVVAAATLNLPVGLFILTYFSTDRGITPATVPTAGRSTASSAGFPSSSVITPDPFPGIPESCIRPMRFNEPNISRYPTNYTPTGFRRTRHQTFCVFNVSRLGRVTSMMPMDMPLDYCTSIVYWSLGVDASGDVRSRVDKFDNSDAGLYKWRDMLDRLGFNDTKIMLAVGGYPPESLFFSRLGRDSGAMARFVTSLMKMVMKSSANGILIDWVEPEPGCGRPDHWTTLPRLVDTIRRGYRLSGNDVGSRDIAILISQNYTVAEEVLDAVANRVEWVFLQTHLLLPSRVYDNDICHSWAHSRDYMLKLALDRGIHADNICAGFSMAPVRALGWTNPQNFTIGRLSSLISPITGRRSTTSMVNICASYTNAPCQVRSDGWCLVLRKRNDPGNVSSPAPFYMFEGRELMHSLLSKNDTTTNFCAVVYDLDADNFRTPCPALYAGTFAGLRHLANVTEDPQRTSDLERQPVCP
ncbi:hypothetical protein MTO96_026515 [Rhipicephalus appendiculatus]